MYESNEYYNNRNTVILDRKKSFFRSGGGTAEDPYRANWKLPSNYFKLLTKQKVNYLINKKTTIPEEVEEIAGKFLRNELKKIGEKASVNGYSALQVYINKEGKFSYKIIPSNQIIPFWKDDELVKVIRVYKTNEFGKEKEITEIWDMGKVTYFEKNEGNYNLLNFEDGINPRPHIIQTSSINNNIVDQKGLNWGRPPFCILKNNDELTGDLYQIKDFIDVYDIVSSDFANNIDDFQDLYWVLKNYQGQDIDEFFENMKRYKSVKVGEDGSADTKQIEIPTEARKTFLDIVEKLIYKFGMGVNPDDIEGNITNVRIKALYSNLDLKANDFEGEVIDFWNQFIYFVNMFQKIKNRAEVENYIEFDRSMMLNKVELATLSNQSIGAISEETRLKNDYRVENVEEEIARMKEEREPQILPEG